MILLGHVNFLPSFQNTEEICCKGVTYAESKVQGKIMLWSHAQSRGQKCNHTRLKQEFVTRNICFMPVVISAFQLMCCV
jgi:hypothetical protein